MRILINPPASGQSAKPAPANLTLIRQPTPRVGLTISILAGLGLALIPFALLSIEAWILPRVDSRPEETIPAWIVPPALLVCMLAHEFLHLIWHPGGGCSTHSMVLIWPRRFQVGVYYEGFMTRSRWLVMRLAPLLGLTLLPTLLLFVAHPDQLSFLCEQFIVLVIVVNCWGAGADVVASVIVAQQVPAGAEVGNWNGRAYWRQGFG